MLCLGMLSTLASTRAAALTFTYDEDFLTTAYRDADLTTAWWDTLSGEIKLFAGEIGLTGIWDTTGSAVGVAARDTLIYVANDTGGLQLVSIQDPLQPRSLAAVATPGSARGVVVQEDHAYVADGAEGLQVILVQDPLAPQHVGGVDTPGFVHAVAVSSTFAYLAQSGAGLQVVDIGDPTQPALRGAITTADWARDVAISGSHAYVADGLGGLQVIDISNPDDPAIVATLPTADYTFGLFISGDLAYLAEDTAGLRIVDITDPWHPQARGSADTPGSARDVWVGDGYAYVADGDGGFRLVDCRDPDLPVTLGGLHTLGIASGITRAGSLACQASGSGGLQLLAVDPTGYDTVNDRVQSLVLDQSGDPIVRARLTTSQVDSIRWELSVDGGTVWQDFPSDGTWHDFDMPGQALLWRSTHLPLSAGSNPSCNQLTIEWQKLYSHAVIDSICDIPLDQGGQVRVHFTASRHDSVGSPLPITEYAIYRRINPAPKVKRNRPPTVTGTPLAPTASAEPAYPPGDWDFVLVVPADAEDRYATVVPTLADSTAWGGVAFTTLFIRARTATPGVYFDSPPDSGYSMNNLLPSVPTGFVVHQDGAAGNQLTWDPSPDPDFALFRIHRSDLPVFTPNPENLIQVTVGTSWLDTEESPWSHHYLLAAVDVAGNTSPAVMPVEITDVTENELPRPSFLHRTRPNPFNPATTITFDLARSGHVTLSIHDLRGHLICTLLDADLPGGRHQLQWQGKDARGRRVGAGVYSCRLVGPGFVQTEKMVLVP